MRGILVGMLTVALLALSGPASAVPLSAFQDVLDGTLVGIEHQTLAGSKGNGVELVCEGRQGRDRAGIICTSPAGVTLLFIEGQPEPLVDSGLCPTRPKNQFPEGATASGDFIPLSACRSQVSI